MNTNGNAKTGWIVAGILAIVVIVLAWMMWSNENQKDLGTVLEEGRADIVTVRAEIQENCRGPQADEAKCQASLADLAEILNEFSDDVEDADTSTTTSGTTVQ